MQEHGLRDYRGAKEKAGLRLGLEDKGALPTNEEIESAIAERNRIFRGPAQEDLITAHHGREQLKFFLFREHRGVDEVIRARRAERELRIRLHEVESRARDPGEVARQDRRFAGLRERDESFRCDLRGIIRREYRERGHITNGAVLEVRLRDQLHRRGRRVEPLRARCEFELHER